MSEFSFENQDDWCRVGDGMGSFYLQMERRYVGLLIHGLFVRVVGANWMKGELVCSLLRSLSLLDVELSKSRAR